MGVDRAVLLSDRAFGGSDTWATYPQCGFYLSLLGFKTQYQFIEEMAGKAQAEVTA